MKTSLSFLCFGLTLLAFTLGNHKRAGAQEPFFDPGAYQPVMAGELPSLVPGRMWIEANVAEDGLGYSGSYVTLGAKTHIFQDFLDGRWLLEAQGHVSVDSGGLFANIGVERVFSIPAAGADVSGGFWFDYDDDQQGAFAHTMTAVGASAKIKTRKWDLYGNGYFPIGTTNYAQGDPTGANCFLNHSIVLQPGIDSALRGFDAMFRIKPESLAHINGSFEFGGYGYTSDLVNTFGGVRVRSGVQLMQGLVVSAEVNHDNRFDFTGVLSLAMIYGGSARGTEYGLLARDLEPTVRNDHIVRFQQDLVLAIDPDTGLPYNVFHVDNTADPGFADGRVETPFTTLAAAEAAASADDIIFVREGDGTTRGMDQGIVLQDGQLLLGDGVRHLIPVQNGELFVLCNDIDGNLPTITNTTGGPAVTLANRNTVRGFVIDNTVPGAFVSNGIEASAGTTQTTGTIEDVTIVGPVLNGIFLDDIAGNWRFARNNISGSGFDGIFIDNACDPTSVFDFVSNSITQNGRDGIHIEDYDGAEFNFTTNNVNGNFRHGIRMERFKGTGGDFNFIAPNNQGNLGDGISIVGADGNFNLLNGTILNNAANGVNLVDFTNTLAGDRTFIGTTPGGTSNISGNGAGAGANVRIEQTAGAQDVTITNTTLDGGGMGVFGIASGIAADLDMRIIDNVSVDNNVTDGMRFIAEDGASLDFLVENTGAALSLAGNGGNGLAFFAGSAFGGVNSSLNGTIRNVNITGSGANGIFANSNDDGQLGLTIENSTITTSTADGININVDTSPNLAVNFVRADNLTITTSGDDAVDINTFDDSFFDFVLTNSTLTNANAGGNGIEVTAVGAAGGSIDDNRTRLFVQNNTISGFDFNGIGITGSGDARILANIDANTITNNGQGVDATNLPYFHGISVVATGDSVINASITNNSVTANFEQGVNLATVGSGSINAVMIANSISGNDVGEDVLVPITSGLADMTATNAAGGTMCLAMSNNFFTLPAIVTNAGGAASFRLELDGLTNGVGVPTIVGAVTPGPFSAVCLPAFNTEAAAFVADGFPPQ